MVHELRISEVSKQAGVSTDLVRYLESKGFVEPKWIQLKQRTVRDYPEDQVELIKAIAQYINEGFKHDIAFAKAKLQVANPKLI